MEFSRRHNEIQYNPKSGGTQIKKTLVRLTPRIEGTVRDTEGKPVPGVYVRMDLDQGGWHTAFGGDSYSDEHGKIGFTVQSGQKYRCMIEDPHWDAPAIYDIRPVADSSFPVFGGKAAIDDEGRFTNRGVIPGLEYALTIPIPDLDNPRSAPDSPGRYYPLRKITPTSPEMELGDVRRE